MTKKAFKLLLQMQIKGTFWFLGIYALTMAILLTIFSYVRIEDTSWIPISILYTPKIYLLVIGIIYPLISTKLYISYGLTRKQYFFAYLGAMSIISILLLIPVLMSFIYYDNFSIITIVTHYLQLPLFFLIGWTSIIGFQIKKWYLTILGILCSVGMFHMISTIPNILNFSNLSILISTIFLLIILVLFLPKLIAKISFKC